ncbi:MAG TPA: FHA domain-containing protein [Candidatus Limnocylindrales bacterium]|nr:FHA domain-containing protein [Candidatus Limnocylindrales bacterium]
MLPTDLVLFILRLLSALALLLALGIILLFLWRDYRSATAALAERPAKLGRLAILESLDGELRRTNAGFDLKPVTRIGRAASNAVQIDDTFVSADHALLTLRDGRWWLEDQASKNGTLLNGVPISQVTIVTDGDVIEIGNRAFRLELTH